MTGQAILGQAEERLRPRMVGVLGPKERLGPFVLVAVFACEFLAAADEPIVALGVIEGTAVAPGQDSALMRENPSPWCSGWHRAQRSVSLRATKP